MDLNSGGKATSSKKVLRLGTHSVARRRTRPNVEARLAKRGLDCRSDCMKGGP